MTHEGMRVRLHHPCGRLTVAGGWGRDRATSLRLMDHELWFVWRGRGWMRSRQRRYELRPGFCAWMRPGGIYDAGTGATQSLGFTYIHFADPGLADPPEFFELRDVSFMDAVTRRITELVPPAEQALWGQPADAPPAAAALLRSVLLELLERAHHEQAARPSPLEAKVESIAAELRDRPEQRVSFEALARSAGVSAAHFSRVFRSLTGLSPQQYHLRARLESARHLLTESNLSVGQIADTLGYRDVFSFSKQFRRHVGVSPSQYRTPTG